LFWLPDANWIWLYVVTFGFATAARDIVYPMAIQHCFGERSMPQIYGTLMLALVAGGGLGPIFAGGIFDLTGSYQSAFAFFAGMNAFALLACCFIRPERPSQS
jgi:cyanate permease